jgi:uncharacterized Zn-binding protein involved in type VI secretion
MAQPVSRLGDKTTGHGAFPPRPSKEASEDVFANGIGIVRLGDEYEPHGRPGGRHASASDYKHVAEAGSETVKINNKPAVRIGDAVDRDGDAVAAGSANVFIG